ncbi:MAG: hypothetical protein AAF773_21920, partial [Cyanobacteria bacterium P01_D01_bin.115]
MTAKPSPLLTQPASAAQPLDDWIAQHLAPNARVQMRLRGNILHVLTETPHALHQAGAISRLVDALIEDAASEHLVTKTYPQVYQLYIYSRQSGEAKPDWTAPIYLNRLERHQSQLQAQAGAALKLADTHPSSGPTEAAGEASQWP